MSEANTLPNHSSQVDEEHLRLLSIFHFIFAAITGLFALFPILHLIIGLIFVAGSLNDEMNREGAIVGTIFVVFAGMWILLGMVWAGLHVLTGKRLKERTNHTFCMVVSALACLAFPIGTTLGVFSLIVLSRESVKRMFHS